MARDGLTDPAAPPGGDALTAVCRWLAARRASALAVALGPGAPCGDADVAWAWDAADSLARAAAHAGLPGDQPGALVAALEQLIGVAAVDRPAHLAGLAEPLAAVRALAGDPAGAPPTPVPFARVGDAARTDAHLAAGTLGVPVSIDISGCEQVDVPPPAAAALLDALGRVVRDAVVFGGAAVRVVAHLERDTLVVVVGDRGGAGEGVTDGGAHLDDARSAGLAAAGGCIASAGGELTVGVGPWGGASVTIQMPLGG